MNIVIGCRGEVSVITKVFCIKPPPEYIETITREGFKHNINVYNKT